MKYIKTYENNLFKKYMVWDDKLKIDNNYIIIKFISQDINKWIKVLRCHLYDETGSELYIGYGDDYNNYTIASKMLEEHIIYQSDNIEDCKNYLQLKIVTKKYNV